MNGYKKRKIYNINLIAGEHCKHTQHECKEKKNVLDCCFLLHFLKNVIFLIDVQRL